MLAGVEAALREAERASGRLGEFSREFKDEEREAVVCVASREGWALVSPFIVEALDESRGTEVGTDVLALAVEEPGAPFAGVSILGKGQKKKRTSLLTPRKHPNESCLEGARGEECRARLGSLWCLNKLVSGR